MKSKTETLSIMCPFKIRFSFSRPQPILKYKEDTISSNNMMAWFCGTGKLRNNTDGHMLLRYCLKDERLDYIRSIVSDSVVSKSVAPDPVASEPVASDPVVPFL